MNKTWAVPQVDETRCTLCGLCVEACLCHAVTLGDRGPIFSCPEVCPSSATCPMNSEGCCLCEEVCPEGAIAYPFEIILEAGQDGSSSPDG
jgi:formate hydrogenlyase subunit 6/NADH:ubiquinone oxidoreductase subunit I